MEYLTSINPLNGIEIAKFEIDSPAMVSEKLNNANKAQLIWANYTLKERINTLHNLSEYLLLHAAELGKIATLEMGKPIIQSIAEVEKCAVAIQHYADHATQYLQPEQVKTEHSQSFISFQPIGTVLAIMPWNFPYWQVYRAMGAILTSGNAMVLKHASNVIGCAEAIEKSMVASGFPEGLFQLLKIKSDSIKSVIENDIIQAVTFTGSTDAGKSVAATAAYNLKKQVLELGGSDAYVILKDADLTSTVEICVSGRLKNSGQSCIAAKRFIVEKEILAAFEDEFTIKMKSQTFGDPLNIHMNLGPMARIDLRDELHDQVLKSVALGAQILCGGYIPDQVGAFYPPTVLTNVKKGMPAYDEELFGPVASIIVAENTDEAIAIANDTIFGLGGAIFSKNVKFATDIATNQLHAGSISVNEGVSSDPRLPFGGIKKSGYGRELSSYGLREFTNIKSIVVK